MKNTLISIVVTSMLIASGCSASNSSSAWKSIKLTQAKPTLVEVNDNDDSREHGEAMFFEAKLSDESGKPVAQLLGEHIIIDIPGDDGVGDPVVEERMTTMSVVFENGDEIVIQGANTYPANQKIMKADAPQYRAIVGGTGAYKGVRGQIVTTRNSDETYSHVIEYRLD